MNVHCFPQRLMENNHGLFFYAQHSGDVIPKQPNMSIISSPIPISINSGDDLMVKVGDTFHLCQAIDIFNGTNQKALLVNIWVQESLLQESEENLEELNVIKSVI